MKKQKETPLVYRRAGARFVHDHHAGADLLSGARRVQRPQGYHQISAALTKELFTLENFPYVINKMKYWQALANTVTITLASLVIVIICASLAGFAIARIRSKLFRGYYSVLVTLMVIPFIGCLLPLTVQATRLGTYDSIWGCILIQSAWNMPFATFFVRGLHAEPAARVGGSGLH